MRQLQYKINAQDDGKTIGAFLKEREYSRGVLIELKKDETGIRRNGRWAGVNEVLHEGDSLAICLKEAAASEKIQPIAMPLNILYEDDDILVVNKAYDTPVHPSINNYDNTLANAAAYYFEQQHSPFVFRCMNRLDRDTTGITILAKNLLSASILSKRLLERQVTRIYMAFVEGVTPEEGTINLPIGRMERTVIKRQIDEENGKAAVTHYHRLAVFETEGRKVSIVALKLETGRTHQIRVHMAAIGHPLLGDFLYNEENHMLNRQALHAAVCQFKHPITGQQMELTAPLYKDMLALIKKADDGAIDEKTLFEKIDFLLSQSTS